MIVQEHEKGRSAEYHNIEELIFNRASNNSDGNKEYVGNKKWEYRMPTCALRYMTDEQRERLTI